MAKYCTKCGKKLEEGQKCDCDKKEKVNTEVVEEKEVITINNDMLNDYVEVVKGMFTHPVDTMKEYSKRSKFNLALIMILINCLISGLFVYLFAKEGTVSLVTMMYGRSYSSLASSSMEVPVKVFFIATLLMAVYFLCFGGLLHFISSTICKKESDIKKVYALIGVTSVFTTITTIVAIIGMYINIWIAVIILAIAGVLYLLHLYHGFTELTKIDKNKIAYVFTSAYVITLFITLYILPKIFS